jgi:hypothetical protein
MADKLLISVTAEQVTAGISRNGKLGACQVFLNDAQGREDFDRFLARLRNAPALVLLDVVEEDYRFEMLPHATGRDRSELLDRRLRQLYRNTPYCGALHQGRDTGKRRDDQYLFFALLNPDLLEIWLTQIRAHDLPVAGVYLLPVVAEPLAQKLAPDTANLLLVSRHPSGLRLTFFRHGKLRVSRLTQVEGNDPRGRIAAYTEEIANTRLYLHAMRVMTLDEHLSVVALDRDGSLGGMEQAVAREIANAQAVVIGAEDIAQHTGVPAAVVNDAPDALYLHQLGAQPARGNLAPEPVTERFHIYQLRRALYAAAALAAVVSFAWLGLNAYQIYDLKSQQAHAAVQTTDYQRRYQEVTRHYPAAPTSADNLVQAVQVADRLRATKRSPEAAMTALSHGLDQYANIRLKSLGWKYSNRDYDTAGGARKADAPGAGAPGTPTGRRQSAFVDAEIQPFNGDYRTALDTIEAFAETLRKDPSIDAVKVVALPLNVSPGTALSGSTAESVSRATNAPFRLNVVFKPTL